MKVRFQQSGGMMGTIQGCEIDAEALPSDTRKELERLVLESGIEQSSESLSDTGRDLQVYEIMIEDKTTTSIVVDDSTLPQRAKPLVGFLKQRARPKSL